MSACQCDTASLLSEKHVDYPATSNGRARSAAVGKHLGTRAACVFQRVRQDRQVRETPVIIDRPCNTNDGAIAPGEPRACCNGRPEGDRSEDAAQHIGLNSLLGVSA